MIVANAVLVDGGGRVTVTPVDVTETDEERRRGLAGRTSVERPMLFQEERSGTLHYTMHAMLVPIDIAFVTPRGHLFDGRTVRPGEEVFHNGSMRVTWVIEMPAGWLDRFNLRRGRLQSILVPNAPPLARLY